MRSCWGGFVGEAYYFGHASEVLCECSSFGWFAQITTLNCVHFITVLYSLGVFVAWIVFRS